jgi:Uma2 family endonuclease
MATVATRPMTADDFFEFVHRPENTDRSFELERGEVVEMPPPTKHHGFVRSNTSTILPVFAVRRKKGYPCSNDSGIIVENDPDTVRGPMCPSMKMSKLRARWMENTPRPRRSSVSPNQVAKRVGQFLAGGVGLVWIRDPEARGIAVYQAGKLPKGLDDTEELTGEAVLPRLPLPRRGLLRPAGAILII